MILITDEENTYTLKDVPTKYNYNGPGHQTEIGEIQIQERGSFGIGDVNYIRYHIESDKPIVSVTVVGGDDRQDIIDSNMGPVYEHELIFKKIPETINLIIVARGSEVKKIPFEMVLSIGF